jgi:integrase
MAALRRDERLIARSLAFVMLTASRAGEVRLARWQEIDLEARLWTVPAERMKARVAHQVPLSGAAIAILRAVKAGSNWIDPADFIFANGRGRPLAANGMLRALERIASGMTVHGLRSTFRDWAGDRTQHDREVAEHALAHTVRGVEGDYRGETALDKRRALMDEWARYLVTPAELAVVA